MELEYAAISDRKMRGQLRNPGEIEKTVRFDARVPDLPELMFLAGGSLTPLAQWHCRRWEIQVLFIRIDSWQCDENKSEGRCCAGDCAVHCRPEEGQQGHQDPAPGPKRRPV